MNVNVWGWSGMDSISTAPSPSRSHWTLLIGPGMAAVATNATANGLVPLDAEAGSKGRQPHRVYTGAELRVNSFIAMDSISCVTTDPLGKGVTACRLPNRPTARAAKRAEIHVEHALRAPAAATTPSLSLSPGSCYPVQALPPEKRGEPMDSERESTLLRIFLDTFQKWHHRPVYEVVVEKARAEGLAGAIVLAGVEGFGQSGRLLVESAWRLGNDREVIVEMVDAEERIEAFLTGIEPLLTDAVVTVERARVVSLRPAAKEN